MIPKKIHYCWFGRGKMPNLAEICLESWKKHLPDYELVLWNEDSFDINSIPFTKQAYESKKYAFVTDYVRLYALYTSGGVYMDTDVEVIKNLDYFLQFPAFSGFEDEINIPTGIMASCAESKWIKYLLDYYNERSFIKDDGTLDTLTNTAIIGNMTKKWGFIPNNTYQCIGEEVHLFPKDYFCPKSQRTAKIHLTKNTYCIHHFSGSWLPARERRLVILKRKIVKVVGIEIVEFFISLFQLKKLKKYL